MKDYQIVLLKDLLEYVKEMQRWEELDAHDVLYRLDALLQILIEE